MLSKDDGQDFGTDIAADEIVQLPLESGSDIPALLQTGGKIWLGSSELSPSPFCKGVLEDEEGQTLE